MKHSYSRPPTIPPSHSLCLPASLLSQLRSQSAEASQTLITVEEGARPAQLPGATIVYGVVQPDGSLLVPASQLQGMHLMAGVAVRLHIEHADSDDD